MAFCLIAVNLAPDNHNGDSHQGSRTSPESPVEDGLISDRTEVADLRKAVGLLIFLGLAPFLTFLLAHRWAPELLRIDITPTSSNATAVHCDSLFGKAQPRQSQPRRMKAPAVH